MIALAAAAFVVSGVWAMVASRADTGTGLLCGGLALGRTALLVVQMRRAPRVELNVTNDQLLVRFSGWDTLWTLRREVRVPLSQI